MSLSVMLCDDQPVLRYGLRLVLEAEPGIVVVCEAGDGSDVVREAMAHQPDVLVLDPQQRGFAVIEEVRAAVPTVAVLAFTWQDQDLSCYSAVQAGARGYLFKDADSTEIVQAVRCVATGSAVFGSRVSERLAGLLTRPAPALGNATFARLTERELQVLELMATGLSNSAISHQLRVAVKTISNHVSTIFAKLHVTGRPEAIVLAHKGGLGVAAGTAHRPKRSLTAVPPVAAPDQDKQLSANAAAMGVDRHYAAAAGMTARH
ncbi:DNA-binding NarL/FixJ family response regulator [Kibdelosporangium banguiense]|uniref:DNA-binding NarL/FixJ family response regulator n=1 Tax=Kibdelosporangium banguiense TaxID=1365924 RepID=A0ABS4TVI2_9PSEU|nr:response regulator transcription factor [Kibdelosporangium banguiense]MBP2328417.1 DNA-binding NarL/FixJ family response regulator [Kibdelosporangium banguiense]